MTNQQGAPEALQPIHRFEVVDCIDSKHVPAVIPNASGPWVRYEDHAAALCRLNAYCQELESQVIRDCMTHVQNPAEIEHVAGDVSKNWAETNMSTQQPAPATQQAGEALSDDLRDRLVAISEAVADQDDRAAQAMLREILKAPQADSQPAPIDMVLHCPTCGLQHIDRPDGVEDGADWNDPEIAWTNPPHRSHLCHGCGHIWRPADVPTNGVKAVKTTGKADSQPAPDQRQQLDAYYSLLDAMGWESKRQHISPETWAADLLRDATAYRAARAPADSVTAPAGGEVAGPVSTVPLRELGVELRKVLYCLGGPQLWALHRNGSLIRYLDQFENDFVDSALAAAPTPPAQAADSVLEDAARYRWLRHGDNDEKVLCNGPVAKDYWYLLRGEKLDAAIDAARKQGGV